MRLAILPSSYELETIYEEKSNQKRIKDISVDSGGQSMQILVETIEDNYVFTHEYICICLKSNQIAFTTQLTNLEMIGRLCSGLYLYHNGHIYYENSVIKIRMDLI